MALPYTPNEPAREKCLATLQRIRDRLNAGSTTTVDDAEQGLREACTAVGRLLSATDMDDVCDVFDDIILWAGND